MACIIGWLSSSWRNFSTLQSLGILPPPPFPHGIGHGSKSSTSPTRRWTTTMSAGGATSLSYLRTRRVSVSHCFVPRVACMYWHASEVGKFLQW